MSGVLHFLKTILIPLSLATILYLTLAHVLLPFIRRHRARYSQYLPLPLPTSSSSSPTTSSWRTTLPSALAHLFIPSRWRNRHHRTRVVDASQNEYEEELFDEEGEGMVGFDAVDVEGARREALEQRRSLMVGSVDLDLESGERRLSRELEEGFRDDSSDDGEDERRRSLSRGR